MQRNSPFYLTENVEVKIKDMFKEDRKKLVPFYPIINFEISRELSKLKIFNIEQANKHRFYCSKDNTFACDSLNIMENQIKYLDAIEKKINQILSVHRAALTTSKKTIENAIEDRKKDNDEMKTTVKELEILKMVNKLPEDVVLYIASYFAPKLRILLLQDRFSTALARISIRNPNAKVHKFRKAIQLQIKNSQFREYTNSSALPSKVHNAGKYVYEICAGTSHDKKTLDTFYGNKVIYNSCDLNSKIVEDIRLAIYNCEILAEYDTLRSAPQKKDVYYPNTRQMKYLLKMYQTVLYFAKNPVY